MARRPRILPPKDIETSDQSRAQDPRVLHAIGRAWAWRRRMERGEVTTIADLAAEEGLSDRYVSRLLRLARLAPEVLERLVIRRGPPKVVPFDVDLLEHLVEMRVKLG
ncbi:MAG: hypothetical protein NXI11_14010 [Proteobacteria bacterium]|nr:hypothetical protein [Pseudomonadota bacterium]